MKKHLIKPPYSHGPFSLQILAEDLFYRLSEGQHHSEEFLIPSGLHEALTPALIRTVKHSSQKLAIGLHRGENSMDFYLFNNATPHLEASKPSVLLKIQAGIMQGLTANTKYQNVILMDIPKKNINMLKNQLEIIYWVLGEAIELKHSGRYLLEEEIDDTYIFRISPFKEKDLPGVKIIRKGPHRVH